MAEAWIKEKDKVPTQIIQVGGCAFRDAQKLVRNSKGTSLSLLIHIFLTVILGEYGAYHLPKNPKMGFLCP